MTRVSIIVPLHNKGPYIEETIHSVLAQTMLEWEMIVVENGSTDQGPEIVRQFSDPRIKFAVSPKRGPGAARNVGLGLATGEWVLFLDSDDLIEPDYLTERLGLATTSPEADLLAGCWEEFPDGHSTQRSSHQPAAFCKEISHLENAAIAFAPWILHAALVRRSRLTPERRWPEHLDELPSEDAAFWFPVICGSRVAWSERAGALYRLATANSRNEMVDIQRSIQGVVGVIRHNFHTISLSPRAAPSTHQVATAVRVLESRYRLALRRPDRSAAMLALLQAESLLNQFPAAGGGMQIRRLLGLRLFNFIRFGVI